MIVDVSSNYTHNYSLLLKQGENNIGSTRTGSCRVDFTPSTSSLLSVYHSIASRLPPSFLNAPVDL